MSFPFSVIGTFIYIGYVVLVLTVIVFPIWKWLLKDNAWKGRFITIIALLLLSAPIVEELWIQHQFKNACKDAGIHVERKAEVPGYYDSTYADPSNKNKTIDEPADVKRLLNEGFSFWEVRTMQGKVRHREIKNGKIEQTIIEKPQARYHLRHTHDHFLVGHQLEKFERDIFDSLNKEVISRDTSYARYTSWIEGLWVRFLGSGQQICRGPLDEPEKQSRIVPFLTRAIAPK